MSHNVYSSIHRLTISMMALLMAHAAFAEPLDDEIDKLRDRAKTSAFRVSVVPGDAQLPIISDSTGSLNGMVPTVLPDASPGKSADPKQAKDVPPGPTPPRKEEIQAPVNPAPSPVPDKEQSTIWNLDSQAKLAMEPLAAGGYEETGVTVQRAVVAVGVKAGNSNDPLWRKKVTLTIPVLFKTGTLRLDEEHAARAKELIHRMDMLANKLQEIKADETALLKEWDALVTAGTPSELLAADSPSLPIGTTVAPSKPQEGFETGKAIEIGVQ